MAKKELNKLEENILEKTNLEITNLEKSNIEKNVFEAFISSLPFNEQEAFKIFCLRYASYINFFDENDLKKLYNKFRE